MVSMPQSSHPAEAGAPAAFVARHESAAGGRVSDSGDQRKHPRYPAWIEATLHDYDSGAWQHVMIVDVSLGGAAIQLSTRLAHPPRGRVYMLTFEWRLRLCEFFGEVVGESHNLGRDHLHVRFLPTEWKQTRALQSMISGLEAEPLR